MLVEFYEGRRQVTRTGDGPFVAGLPVESEPVVIDRVAYTVVARRWSVKSNPPGEAAEVLCRIQLRRAEL